MQILVIFQALELLPPSTKIHEILGYLENVLELKAATRHRCQILRNMLFAESLQVLLKMCRAWRILYCK